MSTLNVWASLIAITATTACSGSDSGDAAHGAGGNGSNVQSSCPSESTSTSLADGASGEHVSPAQIAVTASSACWIDGDGSVLTVPLTGGAPTKLFSGAPALAIAGDKTSVYVLDTGGAVHEVSPGGGEPVQLGEGTTGVYSRIAVGPSAIYWSSDKKIETLPLAGGTAKAIVEGSSNAEITTVAVDDDGIYWLSNDSSGIQLHHAGLDGANAGELGHWDGVSSIALALDADNAYVSVTRPLQQGSLYRVSKSGGSPTELASHQPESVVVSSDGENVYYGVHLTGSDSRVRRVAVAGGTPTEFACGSGHIFGLVAGAQSVVWVLGRDGGGWNVYSTAK